MTVLDALAAPMGEGDLSLEPLAEQHRAALKAACAEDGEIWKIYATSYDPDHFDSSFDGLLAKPDGRSFALMLGGKLVGMSSYIGIDLGRMALEIGSTFYVPAVRLRQQPVETRVEMIGIVGRGVDLPDLAIFGAGGLQPDAMRFGQRLEAEVALRHRQGQLPQLIHVPAIASTCQRPPLQLKA